MSSSSSELSPAQQGLIQLITESWRLSRLCVRLIHRIEPSEQQRYAAQLRFFQNALQSCSATAELELVTCEGQPYDTGAAVTPLNLSDFAADDPLVVAQMVEPIIMQQGRILKTGTVILAKGPT